MADYEVSFAKIFEDAVIPARATSLSAGFDISSAEDVVIKKKETYAVSTGLCWDLKHGELGGNLTLAGFLLPRSGVSKKTNLRMANSVGLIDADYRGEIKVLLQNTGSRPEEIKKGMRIAQLVILPVCIPEIKEVKIEDLSETDRGAGGFGSTGV